MHLCRLITRACHTTTILPNTIHTVSYDALVASRRWAYDGRQHQLYQRLQKLANKLPSYQPATALHNKHRESHTNASNALSEEDEGVRVVVPRGLYIHGDVGSGKTAMMDYFFNTVQIPHERKRRIHFHAFIHEVHVMVREEKSRSESTDKGIVIGERQGLWLAARRMAAQTWLLCFDEFQVIDVADALMMHMFFSVLWESGTVVVATSNRRPADLYLNGPNREYFEPFIEMIQRWCIIFDMQSHIDYRSLCAGLNNDRWLFSMIKNRRQAMDILGCSTIQRLDLPFGRVMDVNYSSDINGCVLTYENLCKNDLGPNDFAALALKYQRILVLDVPVFLKNMQDEAMRFVTFIDQVYDARCLLLYTAAASPKELFIHYLKSQTNTQAAIKDDVRTSPTINSTQAILASDPAGGTMECSVDSKEISPVTDMSLAVKRAVSRLVEMNSVEYQRNVVKGN